MWVMTEDGQDQQSRAPGAAREVLNGRWRGGSDEIGRAGNEHRCESRRAESDVA